MDSQFAGRAARSRSHLFASFCMGLGTRAARPAAPVYDRALKMEQKDIQWLLDYKRRLEEWHASSLETMRNTRPPAPMPDLFLPSWATDGLHDLQAILNRAELHTDLFDEFFGQRNLIAPIAIHIAERVGFILQGVGSSEGRSSRSSSVRGLPVNALPAVDSNRDRTIGSLISFELSKPGDAGHRCIAHVVRRCSDRDDVAEGESGAGFFFHGARF